jgi:hypothetical protein
MFILHRMEIEQCYVNVQVTDLWKATSFSLVDRNQRFEETCYVGLQHENRSVLTDIDTDIVPNYNRGDPSAICYINKQSLIGL